jgi:uncharacterized membrane protein YuzA (DUF378 family)
MVKMSLLKRVIYGLVGLAGVFGLGFLILSFNVWASTMNFWSGASYVLLMIGGLNWGAVAITGKEDMNLLSFL